MVVGPVTVRPSQSLRDALEVMREHEISGVPVVDKERPVGILTARDIRFEQNLDQPVSSLMTKELVTVPPGVSAEEAKRLLHRHRIEKLLVVDGEGKLAGLITIKDILQADRYPKGVKDEHRRLRVGAAIGPGADRHDRTAALVAAGADVIVIDTAHGHHRGVIDAVSATKREFPGWDHRGKCCHGRRHAGAHRRWGRRGQSGHGAGKYLHNAGGRWRGSSSRSQRSQTARASRTAMAFRSSRMGESNIRAM